MTDTPAPPDPPWPGPEVTAATPVGKVVDDVYEFMVDGCSSFIDHDAPWAKKSTSDAFVIAVDRLQFSTEWVYEKFAPDQDDGATFLAWLVAHCERAGRGP